MSERRRESSPRPRGANADLLKNAQEKWKTFNAAAKTEYDRLLEVDSRRKLNVNNDPAQHATFVHLSTLRDGEYVLNCKLIRT